MAPTLRVAATLTIRGFGNADQAADAWVLVEDDSDGNPTLVMEIGGGQTVWVLGLGPASAAYLAGRLAAAAGVRHG